jgi:uncharacterized protein HemY
VWQQEAGHLSASSVNQHEPHFLGWVAFRQGEYREARKLQEQRLAAEQALIHKQGMLVSFITIGIMAAAQQDYLAAYQLYEQSLALGRQIGDLLWVAKALRLQGHVVFAQGDHHAVA